MVDRASERPARAIPRYVIIALTQTALRSFVLYADNGTGNYIRML